MPRKKKVIPEYGTCIRKGIEYYRTRIVDSDGKRVSLYARTPEELYEKVKSLTILYCVRRSAKSARPAKLSSGSA